MSLGERTSTIEKPVQEPRQNRSNGLGFIGALKYSTHCSLAVTERVINGLTNVYKNTFVTCPSTNANFYIDQGFNCFDKGDYDNAIVNFLESLENGAVDNSEVLFYLGLSYVNVDSPEKALPYLKKADELEKNDPDIATEIGSCFLKLEQYPQAIEHLKKAIELSPDILTNYYQLGTAYEKKDQMEEAVEMYRKAIDLDPKDPIYYHALGFVFETMGKHNDAISCFKKAMELEKNR